MVNNPVLFNEMNYSINYKDKLKKFTKNLKKNNHNLFVIPMIVINLKRSKERLIIFYKNISKTNKLLKSHGFIINVIRFNAIDGLDKERLYNAYNDKNIINNSKQSHLEFACTASHLYSIKQFFENKDNIAFICEDDIDIYNFGVYFETFIDYLNCVPENWNILQLLPTQPNLYKNKIYNIYKWIIKIAGAGFYLINKKGIEKIYHKFFTNNIITFNNGIVNYTSDYIIYKYVNTYTSSFPFGKYPKYNNSTIHSNHLDFHKINLTAIDNYLLNFNNIIKHNHILKINNNLKFKQKSDYLLFISAGDNSIYLNDYILNNNYNIDLVIYYYGDNPINLLKYKKLTPYVYQLKNIKFDNFYHFYVNNKNELLNYKYVAIFDDDIILTKDLIPKLHTSYNEINFNSNFVLLNEIFKVCEEQLPWMCQPSCHTVISNKHRKSWWKITHKHHKSNFHYTNFIETGGAIFKIECLEYIFNKYIYKEIPSWVLIYFFINT